MMRIFGISVAVSDVDVVCCNGCGAGMVRVKGRPSLPFWFGMEIMMSLDDACDCDCDWVGSAGSAAVSRPME